MRLLEIYLYFNLLLLYIYIPQSIILFSFFVLFLDSRHEYAKKCIKENLVAEVEDLFHEGDTIFSTKDDIEHVKIFTVSAKNYMQLIGKEDSRTPPIYTSIFTIIGK